MRWIEKCETPGSDPEISYSTTGGLCNERTKDHGVGTVLLRALLQAAAAREVPQLTLNLERENPAPRLYRRMGFREVDNVGNVGTMVVSTSD